MLQSLDVLLFHVFFDNNEYIKYMYLFCVSWGESASHRDKTSLIDYKIDNSKDRCYRYVQSGNVSRRRVYLVTEPVIGQNPRRIYSKHAIASKR